VQRWQIFALLTATCSEGNNGQVTGVQAFTASGANDRQQRQTTISHNEGHAGIKAQRNEVNRQRREAGMSKQQQRQWQWSSSFKSESSSLKFIFVDDDETDVRTRMGGIGARGRHHLPVLTLPKEQRSLRR
jgi:hypothetical protein